MSVSSLVFLLSLSNGLFSLALWSSVTLQSGGISSLFRLFSGKSFFSSGVNFAFLFVQFSYVNVSNSTQTFANCLYHFSRPFGATGLLKS